MRLSFRSSAFAHGVARMVWRRPPDGEPSARTSGPDKSAWMQRLAADHAQKSPVGGREVVRIE